MNSIIEAQQTFREEVRKLYSNGTIASKEISNIIISEEKIKECRQSFEHLLAVDDNNYLMSKKFNNINIIGLGGKDFGIKIKPLPISNRYKTSK